LNSTFETLERILGLDDDLDFKTFVESPDYLGLDSVYKFWMDAMSKLPDDLEELDVDGSLGGGKSYIVAIYLVYRLVRLFRQGDPSKVLGLADESDIFILYFSVSKFAARDSGFKYIIRMVDRCKWLRDHCPRDTNVDSEIRFPNHVTIQYASAEGHQIGLNVWGFILDEANFRKGLGTGVKEQYESTVQLCSQLLDRQTTRFSTPTGVNRLAIFVSSAAYSSSFMESRKELARLNPKAAVITAVQYKINPHKFSKEKFEVFVGYGSVEPCIVTSSSHRSQLLKQAGLIEENSSQYFEYPPVSIKSSFDTNVYLALQNHCGRSTSVKGSFFTNIPLLKSSYCSDLVSPFIQTYTTISNQDDSQIMDIFDPTLLVNPELPHSLFLDLSITGDSGSISCVRFDNVVDGIKYHTHVFTLEIIPPPPPGATMITKVYQFIVKLADYLNIVAFGSDNFQSMQIRQDVCLALGIENIRVSLDSSDVPFLHWVSSLVSKRFKMLGIYPKLETEIKEADHDLKRRRVVKRAGSSDDQFQSLVGAFFLSDTVAALGAEDLKDLYPGDINLIGGKSVNSVLKICGYSKF